MDRRDLLRRFGVGAIIVPIIGGTVERSAAAELIEVPKVRPVELFTKIPGPVELDQVVSAQVVLDFRDGQTRTFKLDKWPWGEGKIGIADSLSVDIEFMRVSQSSPKSERPIGRIQGDAKLL